ncbi:hypothetical protein ACQPXM_08595 [Kribbella sp. CA-253562]|uniref:hypothetical protein n=1 Tax=Kribbella sp. CA-253562 TaxID=3239942 RepID=UPI003D8D7AD5
MNLAVRRVFVSMSRRARGATSAVLLLAMVIGTLTVTSAAPASAREPSPPTNCSTGVDRRAKAWAMCKSGYGTFRVWARCNWSATKVYGGWMRPSRFGDSEVFCATSSNPAGIVMARGIQKREG